MADEDWAVVYPDGDFPKGAVRAMSRGLKCDDDPNVCDSYVALWIRDDGEAVFGRAWNEGGKMKASFPWGGREVREDETRGVRILTYIGPKSSHDHKYKWVRAKDANPDQLVYSGEYLPAVVEFENGDEILGKANWNRRMAWSSCHGKENVHEGNAFDNAHLLVKIPSKH